MRIQDNPPIQVATQDGLAIARGLVPGVSVVHKFGHAPDFDTTDGQVDIWDGANDTSPNLMVYTYSATADIDSLSSSNAGDTQKIEVQGLDKNYQLIVQTITLTGQTRVGLTTSLIRVFRMKNMGATTLAGTCYCFVNVATTSGVPDTLTNIRAMIEIGNNQTMMCLYTIPSDSSGYLDGFYFSLAGAVKTSAYVLRVYARPYGGVFQLKHEASIDDAVDGNYTLRYAIPEKFPNRTDIALRVEALAGGVTAAQISGGFELILVKD